MSGRIEARLKELGIELPEPTAPMANYVPFTVAGNLVFVAGQICQWNGERRHVGKLGADIGIEEGRDAARLCALNILTHLRTACGGDLDRVRRVVAAARLCQLHAGVHRHAASRQRRLGSDGRDFRRSRDAMRAPRSGSTRCRAASRSRSKPLSRSADGTAARR